MNSFFPRGKALQLRRKSESWVLYRRAEAIGQVGCRPGIERVLWRGSGGVRRVWWGRGRIWATVLSRTNKQECPDAQQCGREWYDGQSANPPAHPRPLPHPRSLLERQPKRRQVPAGRATHHSGTSSVVLLPVCLGNLKYFLLWS